MKVKIKGGKAVVGAATTALWDYYVEAEERFLKEVEKGIKKLVGSKLKVKTTRSRSTVWVEGEGENQSDMEFSFWLNMVVQGVDVKVYLEIRDAMRGTIKEDFSYKSGVLTATEVVSIFKRYWAVS